MFRQSYIVWFCRKYTSEQIVFASAQVTHFSMYLLIDKREYLDDFDWVEEYTLYKEYDEIELVFVIDNSSSMLISDPNNSRESIAVSIANAFPNNTDTSAHVLANNSIISLSDQDGTIIWQSQNTQYALPVITYQTGGDLRQHRIIAKSLKI